MSEFDAMSIKQLMDTAEECLEENSDAYNPVKAADLFERAAGLGSMTSLEKLGDCYFYGRGRDEDDKTALEAYAKAFAATGSSYSAYQLGRMYGFGWGVKSNSSKARDFLEKSWADGYAAAAGILGDICLESAQETKDARSVEEALKWYQRGLIKNDPYSTYRMALVFSMGDYGVPEDKKRAYDLLMKASDYPRALGYLVANNGLNMCSNDQFSEFVKKAVDMAESMGDGRLFRCLGRAYEGKTRLGEAPEKSIAYYEKALAAGDGFAGYIAGSNYLHGWYGYPEDAEKAEQMLTKGSDLGCEQAMSTLGDLHKKRAEEVWPPNLEEMRAAFEWYEKAYLNGGTTWDAMHAGEAALKTKDDSLNERAVACLKSAMEDDIYWSYIPLVRFSLAEGASTYNPNLARQSLEKARNEKIVEYETGEVDYLTGLMFEKGLGLPAAANQAVEFYLKASDKGSEEAKDALKRFKKGIFGWKLIK